ncbi:TBC1 domain family member 2B [Acipenser ruthenus]|uniref:TBC1 domain family member 2B n=1 Tax=Acipenser ruthenus TaxID=7906 RepID=A0A444U0N1_ACIRT|nr:TBC1 domain family member 2B [Acipenser ruthenus]
MFLNQDQSFKEKKLKLLMTGKLMNIAFNDMNPFPMKLLKNRREFHMERLTAELQELERIQEEFVKEQQVERKDKDLDTAVSEDEEVIQTAVSLHHTS